MLLFLSTVTNKVDPKGRVSVPSAFRTALSKHGAEGIVVFCSTQQACLEGFDMSTMQEISERLDQFDMFSEDQDSLAMSIFGESHFLPMDADGRVVLPAELMDAAHIVDSATFVGLGKKFQIWNPQDFKNHATKARAKVREKKLTVPRGDLGKRGAP